LPMAGGDFGFGDWKFYLGFGDSPFIS